MSDNHEPEKEPQKEPRLLMSVTEVEGNIRCTIHIGVSYEELLIAKALIDHRIESTLMKMDFVDARKKSGNPIIMAPGNKRPFWKR